MQQQSPPTSATAAISTCPTFEAPLPFWALWGSPLLLMGGKANMHHFRYIFRPKMGILSTRLLGVPFGPQGAMPDPAPHRGVPGTKEFNKMTKKCTGDKPRPLPGAEPARWAATQEVFQAPWGLPWTWDWVQVWPWGQKLASFQRIWGFRSTAGAIVPNVASFFCPNQSLAPPSGQSLRWTPAGGPGRAFGQKVYPGRTTGVQVS